MRLLIALENRFYEAPSGNIYSINIFEYSIWQKYLQVFDEVIVFARVGFTDRDMDKPVSNGPGVKFYRLPMYVGPKQYILNRGKLLKLAKDAPNHSDAFILRMPGPISSLLWKVLRKKGIPFGVEVVGNTIDAHQNCGAHPLLRPLFKSVAHRYQTLQCKEAVAAAYVSKDYLQSFYPSGGWSTYYSSIDLRDSDILNDDQLTAKIKLLKEPFEGKRPFIICHAGTMGAKYKGQDLLIEAVANCKSKGLNIELVLMGDGGFRDYFESKAKELGAESFVKFMGNVPGGKAVRDVYDKCDILVFPSLTEGLPRTIIEAMARGLGCIASNVGGIPELLDNDFLVNPGNVEELTNKIYNLLQPKTDIESIAIRNINKAKEYHYDILNARRIEFYNKVAQAAEDYKKGK